MITPDTIQPMIDQGYVKAQRHAVEPITVYNYTSACQYDRAWNDVTKVCRGLILHDSGEIVARPFPKFFNMEEHSRSELAFSKPFVVTEKLDGSLGVLYPAHDGWAIATRGSFVSDQAVRATAMLRTAYAEFKPVAGITYLFEIVYPENRIVVDYAGKEALILLATLDTASGRDLDGDFGWLWETARKFDVSGHPSAVIEQLGLVDDGNSEGIVLRFEHPRAGPQLRVKVKLEEYRRLHRLLTMTSSKTVWEALSQGQSLTELMDRVPDEFYDWLKNSIEGFRTGYQNADQAARSEFDRIRTVIGPNASRKEFAELARTSKDSGMLFKLLDNGPIDALIWKRLKPEYSRPFRDQKEDNS